MIWPFKPRPPLSLPHKVSCERKFARIARLIGRHRITNSTVLVPTDLDAIITADSADTLPERLFAFIRSRFPIADADVHVAWRDTDTNVDHATNAFYAISENDGATSILLHPSLAEFPYRVAAVLAAACSECFLKAESLDATASGFDTYEQLPVFFGFGPIMANATLLERSSLDGTQETWEASQVGSTNALEFGYSMALADWVLDTNYGDVVSALRPDARETYQLGIRYLSKTSECYFARKVFDDAEFSSSKSAPQRLNSRSDSVLLGTLIDLMHEQQIDDALADPLSDLIRHTNEDIQQIAAYAIGRCQTLTRAHHDDLLITVETSPVALKRAAVSAMRPGFENDEQIKESLVEILGKTDASTATSCIKTLLKYDAFPENLQEQLLRALARMVLKAGTEQLVPGLVLLSKVSPDPIATLEEHFAEDPSGQAILTDLFREMREA